MSKGLLPHYLYRHYDANNNLLYIGITKDIAVRTNEHKRTSRWIKLSSRIEVEKHKGTYAAAHAEERAIKKSVLFIILRSIMITPLERLALEEIGL